MSGSYSNSSFHGHGLWVMIKRIRSLIQAFDVSYLGVSQRRPAVSPVGRSQLRWFGFLSIMDT